VHNTNTRVEHDLKVIVKHKVPIVITSLGAVSEIVDAIHSYGGIVLHDVTNVRHAEKAVAAGVDGLILVCAGAGGHAGTMSPFALLPEVRSFFDGTVVLAGAVSRGDQIAAAQMMGADLVYMGTRFLATQECAAQPEYKEMIVGARAADITYTPAISGIPANFLTPSLVQAGLDPKNLPENHKIDMASELDSEARAWRDVWSAGQGVGAIADVPAVADLVASLKDGYRGALDKAAALRDAALQTT